jgi:hypothetical protein
MKISVMPCSLVDRQQRFGGTLSLYRHSSALTMQAENTPQTKAPIYKAKRRYIPEYTKVHIYTLYNLIVSC